jgi:hypothetical protein
MPAYVSDLLRLAQGPKSFVAARVSEGTSPTTHGLLFLAMSFLLGWLIKTSFLRGDPLIELATGGTFVFLQVLAYGAALCAAWRVVQGRAELQKIFTIHFYYSGVFLLIMACWFMALMGTLRAADPQFYADLLEATYGGSPVAFTLEGVERFLNSPALVPVYLVLLAGISALCTWIFMGWGAYRQLNQLSRTRSALAAMLFVLFLLPIEVLLFLIANAAVK